MTSFSIGDSVRIKDGTMHADLPLAIGGWQGRIAAFEPNAKHLATVKLDSMTLQSLSELYIIACEVEGLSWSSYVEYVTNLEPCERRDSVADVQSTYETLHAQHTWVHSDGMLASQFDQWRALWHKYATFPFRAVADDVKSGYGSHVPGGSRVRVLDLAQYDDEYGLIANVKYKFSQAKLPLYDVNAIDKTSVEHQLLQMYAMWFEFYGDY
jgi:hypothetical protein